MIAAASITVDLDFVTDSGDSLVNCFAVVLSNVRHTGSAALCCR
ncbi:hypothetical protein [Halocatena halophila]